MRFLFSLDRIVGSVFLFFFFLERDYAEKTAWKGDETVGRLEDLGR